MAGKEGVEAVLSRIDELNGRVATAKQINDLTESCSRLASTKAVTELTELVTKALSDMKGIRTEMAELRESQEKAIRKLREELVELIEDIEPGDGDDGETLNFLKSQVEEVKNMAKAVLGDDATLEAVRGKFRGWLKGEKNGAALGPGRAE